MKTRNDDLLMSPSGMCATQPKTFCSIALRTVQYVWVFPVTLLGLIGVGLTALTGGRFKAVAGTLEAWGGFAEWVLTVPLRRRASAMTIGHVILGLGEDYLARARAHEHVHIKQYEKWGVLFVPLYIGSSLVAWAQGKHYYRDNVFEREAYAKAP